MPQEDLIKRFTQTPLQSMLALFGANIRLETNCQVLADWLWRALTPGTASVLDAPDFVLRVVAEPEDDLAIETATVHRLSHEGLSFISLGRQSFLACDRQTRHGICFISWNLATDEKRFSQSFLPALILLLEPCLKHARKPGAYNQSGAQA
jgi:hypothetical protein